MSRNNTHSHANTRFASQPRAENVGQRLLFDGHAAAVGARVAGERARACVRARAPVDSGGAR